ncbi:unnamed protein product [Microthlaspi erraticum]|uniref:Uncharacterized protein n=1 Tax=Microthlaspi erraticum TaxID=1685480 RepID=A0A6D2JQD3_9BRAS|nr:unnamed protein product [Microthlaspi erraticum]
MLDCGYDAYQLPVVPRAYRSPRRRRQKHRSEFEVLAQAAGKFSGYSNAYETKETKNDFVVNNFLETMEVEVKSQPCDREKPSQVLLSKDWLALGPSISSSPITQEENSSIHDSKTLLQIGIPRDDDDNNHNFSSLGFTLEPRESEITTTLNATCPKTRLRVPGFVESTKMVVAKSVVPVRMKPAAQPETVQRRIRRPFTVSEVEALVQAVESIGTGRWRDVKSHAFHHANHRTYVDLKDKWKTLVHTAKISARQRRGEPVPQELLDRVLAAHSFWSDRPG